MKKIIYLLSICIISFLLILTISCTNDDSTQNIDSDRITGEMIRDSDGIDLIIEEDETLIVEDGTTTTTIPTTTTIAAPTTTLPSIVTESDERLLEKKYAYLLDLTTLTLDNCDSFLRSYENEKETTEDNLKDKRDDQEKKKDEKIMLEQELADNIGVWTKSQIENQNDDIEKAEKKIDELEIEIEDLDDLLNNIEDTKVQIERECKKIKVLAD
ncbi:MAG: hypothetical protein ABII01_00850 [Candidatus Woesearchaeota archaeon]